MATEFTINNYGLLIDEDVRVFLKKRLCIEDDSELNSFMLDNPEFTELTHLEGGLFEVDTKKPFDKYGYLDAIDCPHRLFMVIAKKSPNLFSQSYSSKEELEQEIKDELMFMFSGFDLKPHLVRFAGAIETEKVY